MNTIILIMALISDHGGTSVTQVQFSPKTSGPTAEELCEEAGQAWRAEMRDFTTSAKYICIKK